MAKADSPTKTCGEGGCSRPLRARGLCSTHYNAARYTSAERHPKVTVPCTWCQSPCLKDKGRRYGGRFCKYACREAWRAATDTNPMPSADACAKGRAARDSPRGRARAKLRRAARGTCGSRWVAGTCRRCGSPFTSALGPDLGRYCSDTCKRRASNSRRRARKRGAEQQPYSRVGIFERDGYRCHLCHRLTISTALVPHPRAPVIDHLIPLGPGADAPHNVATACFMCNSKRRDVGPAQLLLFG